MTAEPLVESTDPRERKKYYFGMTPVRSVMTPLLDGIFHLISNRQVNGVENFPEAGPVVLASNHLTNFDVFPMQFALPRPIFFMGKEELFRNPLLDWLLRHLGGFPVYRGAHDQWALNHAQKVLEHGQVLGIFPEGKRSKGVGGLRQAKTGAARLALAVQCPIVPMTVSGTQNMFHQIPRRTKISLAIGKPIHPKSDESPQALTDRLMFTLADMLPHELRGVYAQLPAGD